VPFQQAFKLLHSNRPGLWMQNQYPPEFEQMSFVHKLDPSIRNSMLLPHHPNLDAKGFLPMNSGPKPKQKVAIKINNQYHAGKEAVFTSEETSFRTLADDLNTR
jgi:hypothetical protein